MAKSLHARLVAYRPFGERIGVLAEPVSFSASMLHDDDGAISIEYSMLSGDAQAFDRELTDGLEVAVEVSDGNGYQVSRIMRDSSSRAAPARRMTAPRPSLIPVSRLAGCCPRPKTTIRRTSSPMAITRVKGLFIASNPGTILKTLLDENRARGGVATGLTLGFGTAKDAGWRGIGRKSTRSIILLARICRPS